MVILESLTACLQPVRSALFARRSRIPVLYDTPARAAGTAGCAVVRATPLLVASRMLPSLMVHGCGVRNLWVTSKHAVTCQVFCIVQTQRQQMLAMLDRLRCEPHP
jgi:hypothetical protein